MANKKLGDSFKSIGDGLKGSANQLSPKKVAQTAAQQINGQRKRNAQKKQRQRRPSVENKQNKQKKGSPRATEGLLGIKKIDKEKLQNLKQKDILQRKKGLAETREELARLLIQKRKKYKQMQREIKKAEDERERKERGGQELPDYERGKPGAPETVEEKKERIKKMKEKKEQGQEQVQLPSSGESDSPGLRGGVNKKKKKTETRQWNKG
jgi:hypothetical protein